MVPGLFLAILGNGPYFKIGKIFMDVFAKLGNKKEIKTTFSVFDFDLY